MDGQEHVLRDPEGRVSTTLENIVHRFAVTDYSLPCLAVGVRRVFTVDRGDGIVFGYIDAFYAIGRRKGTSPGHAGQKSCPAARFRHNEEVEFTSYPGCGFLDPPLLTV